jgi:hypothetical protein
MGKRSISIEKETFSSNFNKTGERLAAVRFGE